ncbi:MAG: MCE family protein [Veillonella sp.]|nr:MCE family protein [Veillonella sp.]
MKWTTEAKVGAFTVIGIIAFVAAVLFVGNINLFPKETMAITGQFNSVNGLKVGNAVKYSGVQVGKVTDIEVDNPHSVTVSMDVDDNTHIPKDSTFTISSDGLLGDKFILITPGNSNQYLENGAYINGKGSEMDRAFDSAQKLMEGTEKLLESMNNIIGDPKTQDALRHTLQSTSTMADNTVEITGNLAAMTAQMNATAQQFNADGNAGNDMRAILQNMKDTTDRVDNMAKAMEGTVTDPQAAENIKETLHNTAQITERINKLTGGKPYPKSNNGGDDAADGTGEAVNNKSHLNTELSGDILYNSHQDEYRANARVRLFTNKNLFELGFSNIGDGTDFDLNGGKYLTNKVSVRAGLFESKLGVGLDYGLGGPFSLSAAMYDLNHQRYRIRSEFRLSGDTYGVIQTTRPFSSSNGGTYFGIKQVF